MTAHLRPHHFAAFALALLLTAVWTVQDWASLGALRLPDTDDAMRLQQIRDWIGGQAFGDLHQYRLGPDGLAMHWSRIGDLIPAATILALRPLIGAPLAEVGAVILWPLMQLVALLMLTGSIAERLAPGARGSAMLLALLAYPLTPLFAPGRIDHHALQVLLVLVQARALLAPADARSGAIAGIAIAVGAAIGLETLPFALATGAVIAIGGGRRQLGLGIALAAGLAAMFPLAASGGVCDTVRPLTLPAIAGALAMAATARLDRARLPALTIAAVVIAVASIPLLRPCLDGPYGSVDPLVAKLWLANVEEARPLLALPMTQIVAFAGLMLAGTLAGAWLAWRRGGGWWVVLTYQLASVALALVQLRGVYIGVALAGVPIAALLVEARAAQRTLRVLALWLGGAGLVYPLAAAAFAEPGFGGAPSCTSPAALATLAKLPPGRMMAPIDLGAFAITATRHTLIAAPYHRNNAGNAAMYQFFRGSPTEAQAAARDLRLDYVARCPGHFADRPIPAWLKPITPVGAVPAVYAVDRRLWDAPPQR